jgi:hypothetical protein
MMKNSVKIVSLTVFMALIFLKASNFHVYSHTDSFDDLIENCNSCKMALDQQQNVLLQPLLVSFNTQIFQYYGNQEIKPVKVIFKSVDGSSFTSRPPPIAHI